MPEESDPSDNAVSLTHLVNELADVSVTKLCKPDTGPAPAGTNGVCAIFVTNNGPSRRRRGARGADRHARGERAVHDRVGVAQPGGLCDRLLSGRDVHAWRQLTRAPPSQVDVTVSSSGGVDVNDTARVTSANARPGYEQQPGQRRGVGHRGGGSVDRQDR